MFEGRKRLIGVLTALIACLGLGLLMFHPHHVSMGLGFGVIITSIILFGLLINFGSIQIVLRSSTDGFKKKHDQVNLSTWMRVAAGFNVPLLWIGLSLFWAGLCRLSVIGTDAASFPLSGPLLFGLGSIVLVVAKLKKQDSFDGNFHEGLLVLTLATASVMATLGSHGLWDCWETHYGEVARRQLEQNDWISLFWENKWFFSKPILIFWMMNLGMTIVGAGINPDSISSYIEWGIRLPVGLLAVTVIWALYQLLARRFSKRAGIFVAIIVATMPVFAFMARQAITDLPFVGLMTLAVVLFLLGITADQQAMVRTIRIPISKTKALAISAFHWVIAGYVFLGLTQFVYIATRSAIFRFGTMARGDVRDQVSKISITDLHLSDIFSSVAGVQLKGVVDISLDWFLLGLAFATPFVFILHTLRNERRISILSFHGMYMCLALSVMAKGLPGLVMPILGLFGLWLFYSPWRSLFKKTGVLTFISWHWDKMKRLDLLRGISMFFLVASPWYVAMTIRHGMKFINRFFIHDHIKRLSSGVHGDTGTVQYFIEQFAYAAFPWAAFLPFALLSFYSYSKNNNPNIAVTALRDSRRRMIMVFVASWGFLTFALLSMMVTKYHHYVFPLIPPAAIAIAIFLDDVWEERIKHIGPIILTGIAIIALTARDLFGTSGKGVLHGCAKLLGLFIYKYSRPYPKGPEYDFTMPIMIFAGVFIILLAAWMFKKWRRLAIAMTMIAAIGFGHWTTQHYMISLAPHWTQKHLIAEYYAKRKSPKEKLVAFQMNWKGENFYTGNNAVIRVSTKNKKFEKWVNKHRGERHFFITEQSRFGKMSKRVNAASGELVPLKNTCNKYKIGVADKL